MSDFIDLKGFSGSAYRFRGAQPDTLPASAGNFVCLAGGEDGQAVVCCGATLSLVTARAAWSGAQRQHGPLRLFIRLNVARATRTAEHADLVAAVRPPLVIADAD